jgi:hypothetical protein
MLNNNNSFMNKIIISLLIVTLFCINNATEKEKQTTREQIDNLIDMSNIYNAYNKIVQESEKSHDKAEASDDDNDIALRLEIKKQLLKQTIEYPQNNSKYYNNNLSAMLHGLDQGAWYCYCHNKQNKEEKCSEIRDQEYNKVKIMILAAASKNNTKVEFMNTAAIEQQYEAATVETKKAHKEYWDAEEKYSNNQTPENSEKQQQALRMRNYWMDRKTRFQSRCTIEPKKAPYEIDTLAPIRGLNRELYTQHQNSGLKEAIFYYPYSIIDDKNSAIGLLTNIDIDIQHISILRLIKELDSAIIQHKKTKVEYKNALENLMKTDEGKNYLKALQEYETQKQDLMQEIMYYHNNNTVRVTKKDLKIHRPISNLGILFDCNALECNTPECYALVQKPLQLEGIDYEVQKKFNVTMENYYQAAANLTKTEQFYNDFAPKEIAYYYWKHRQNGIYCIVNKSTDFTFEDGNEISIEKMKSALAKALYPEMKRHYDLEDKHDDRCAETSACHTMRERVVNELFQIIEEIRMEAGVSRNKKNDCGYFIRTDQRSILENYLFKTPK